MGHAGWRRYISPEVSQWYWVCAGSRARDMPSNATEYDGPVDFIGSIDEIAGEIVRRVAVMPIKAAPASKPDGRIAPSRR